MYLVNAIARYFHYLSFLHPRNDGCVVARNHKVQAKPFIMCFRLLVLQYSLVRNELKSLILRPGFDVMIIALWHGGQATK